MALISKLDSVFRDIVRRLVFILWHSPQLSNLSQPSDHFLIPEMDVVLEGRILVIRIPRYINKYACCHTKYVVSLVPVEMKPSWTFPRVDDVSRADWHKEMVHAVRDLVDFIPIALHQSVRLPGSSISAGMSSE